MPESTAHDAAVNRTCSLLEGWARRTRNGARIARNLAVRWLREHPTTGLDPDVAVLLPGPGDFDDLTSLRLWEPGRVAPPLAIEVVSGSHPYKDYSWVHEGYAAMGAQELLVFDPMLHGPKALGGPVALQFWRRDVSGAFERASFGDEPVYSSVLDAWFSADGRRLNIADDRAGASRWLTTEEEALRAANVVQAEADRNKAEADRNKAEADRNKAEADREKQRREELERLVSELQAARPPR